MFSIVLKMRLHVEMVCNCINANRATQLNLYVLTINIKKTKKIICIDAVDTSAITIKNIHFRTVFIYLQTIFFFSLKIKIKNSIFIVYTVKTDKTITFENPDAFAINFV